jgi:hypothetical protein
VPHPPSKMARDSTPRENFSGILHARGAPALQLSLRKDGESSGSLAHEQTLCEVFSITDLSSATVFLATHAIGHLRKQF